MKKRWLALVIMILLMIPTMSWAIRIPYVNFAASADTKNGKFFMSVTMMEDGSATILVESSRLNSYYIKVNSEGTVTGIQKDKSVIVNKTTDDEGGEIGRIEIRPQTFHGESALRELANVTAMLGDILQAPHIDIDAQNKLDAFQALQFWHDHFYYYIPKTPTELGGLKADNDGMLKENTQVENFKGMMKEKNDGLVKQGVAMEPPRLLRDEK